MTSNPMTSLLSAAETIPDQKVEVTEAVAKEDMAPAIPKQANEAPKGNKPDQRKAISFSQLRPFLEIAIPFFREDRNAFCSLVGIVILTLIESALTIAFSYVRRDIFDALNAKDQEQFYKAIVLFFGVLVFLVPVSVLYDYLRLKLALYWRKELTARVLDKYYANRTYYIIECCRDIDNPDQRICEDLTEFTSTSLDFFFILFDAVINLISFSAVLYQIYPELFLAIILYAFVGTMISFRLGRSLVGKYYDKLQREADFRFGLIRTRENAEGIAFYDSEASMEQINLWTLFEKVIETQFGIIRTQRSLEMFTTSYDYLVYVIPYLVVAPLYFSGKIQLGSITQASEAFYYVRSDFSIIVNYFEKISAFSAGIDRLSTFIHRINQDGWHSGPRAVEERKDKKGSLTELTQSLANNPGGYSKVSKNDDIDDITNLRINNKNNDDNNNIKRNSTIELSCNTMKKVSTSGNINVKNDITSTSSLISKCLILNCENLNVFTPDGYRILIGGILGSKSGVIDTDEFNQNIPKGVNFKIYEGDKVLVVGPSGTGKSSLLRAIAGLWELGSGSIIWSCGLNEPINAIGDLRASNKTVSPDGVFFLPQKPYNLLGSLRQQIAYPDTFPGDEDEKSIKHLAKQQKHNKLKNKNDRNSNDSNNNSNSTYDDNHATNNGITLKGDAELLEILRNVKLETLASRMGSGDEQVGLREHKDWTKVLSLGEQQRLAFARVLYNRKNISVVVLDEATSALDEIAESAMYSLLGQLNITFISVGHRPTLYNYHTKKLVLSGPGSDIECVPINPSHP